MRTPLYERHLALGARIINFAGWEMPVWYSGVIAEHTAVREHAGLFDVSHMGEILIQGLDAQAYVERITTNAVSTLEPYRIGSSGQIHYTFLCNEQGGVLDDCTVYRNGEGSFTLVVNAANIKKDYTWIMAHKEGMVEIIDLSSTMGLVAIQGPNAQQILQSLISEKLEKLRYYFFTTCVIGGVKVIISRTGYTGEDGFEMYCTDQDVGMLWDALLEVGAPQGLIPCGLGARDTLRLEAGMALYGHDLDEDHTPLEANLGRFVKLEKQYNFIGKTALIIQQKKGVKRTLVGFMMDGREIARPHYEIYSPEGELIGHVTSGAPSPTLRRNIGLGYIACEYSSEGTEISLRIRGNNCPAIVVKLPFYRRQKKIQMADAHMKDAGRK